ncbi:MAG: phytoene desaturase family protein [Myxococcota bacterium]
MESRVVVIGGGLAGLVASLRLARGGARVTLLERSRRFGGRARTQDRDGFLWNQGPHALYTGGPAARTLRELGIAWSGGDPARWGGFHALAAGRLHALPTSLPSTLATSLLDWRGKVELGRLTMRLPFLRPESVAGRSVARWLDDETRHPEVRALVGALVRLSTYGGEPDRMSADAAVAQLQLAFKGVAYLDGGWQSLVDGARHAAEEAGVQLEVGARAGAVVASNGGVCVELADGRRVEARAAVLAVPPEVAAGLLPRGALDVSGLRPVRAACLDLALDGLPNPSVPFVLGIDEPWYLSVHSDAAGLAPPGGVVLQVAKYLGTGPSDAARDRAELEALCDRAQPGWREHARHVRFLPSMVVHHALPDPERGGLAARPGSEVQGVPRAYLAGDWVGPTGLLLDAAIASASEAAGRALDALALGSPKAA